MGSSENAVGAEGTRAELVSPGKAPGALSPRVHECVTWVMYCRPLGMYWSAAE